MSDPSSDFSNQQPASRNQPSAVGHQPPALRILWKDELLLVVDKPAGLRSLPDGYDPTAPHLRNLLEPLYGRLWIVHRLDKETSGVIMLARSAAAHRSLNLQFDQHTVKKIYHALVEGKPEWEITTVRIPLRANGDRRHRTVADFQGGKLAVTHLRLLECFSGYALLEAQPETGRTHQIRAHLAALGLPIAGDALYGSQTASFDRLMLHAFSLDFIHPGTLQPMHLEAPYPEDFQAALNSLRAGKEEIANPS